MGKARKTEQRIDYSVGNKLEAIDKILKLLKGDFGEAADVVKGFRKELLEEATKEAVPGDRHVKGSDTWFVVQAIERHMDEGTCEIDDNATISRGGEAGAYVLAWVWVPCPEGEE